MKILTAVKITTYFDPFGDKKSIRKKFKSIIYIIDEEIEIVHNYCNNKKRENDNYYNDFDFKIGKWKKGKKIEGLWQLGI